MTDLESGLEAKLSKKRIAGGVASLTVFLGLMGYAIREEFHRPLVLNNVEVVEIFTYHDQDSNDRSMTHGVVVDRDSACFRDEALSLKVGDHLKTLNYRRSLFGCNEIDSYVVSKK